MQEYVEGLISVIMGIYNCAETLPAAMESIKAQTYSNWEIILCDDGSSDDTFAVASEYIGKWQQQVRVIRNESNKGLNHTLNRCLALCRGEFVARMDGDDLCDTKRFEVEIAELRRNDGIDFVSTDMCYFDKDGTFGKISHPDRPEPKDFLRENPFCHAPCMVRRSAYEDVGGYSEDKRLLRVEDYHLWIKMYLAGHNGINLHQTLYLMRDDRNAYSRRKFRYRLNEAYVRMIAIKEFRLPFWNVVYAMKPIIVGLLPGKVYDILHRRKLSISE